MKKQDISTLHNEHTEWLNQLAFYTDEITILKKRIAEIAEKNTEQSVLAMVEHFQNQLIVQKDQIDILSHEIRMHEHSLSGKVLASTSGDGAQPAADHRVYREKLHVFEKLFSEMRGELLKFAAKWL